LFGVLGLLLPNWRTKCGAVDGIAGFNTAKPKANGKFLKDGKVAIIRNGVKHGVNGATIKQVPNTHTKRHKVTSLVPFLRLNTSWTKPKPFIINIFINLNQTNL